ncbi:cuticle protein 7 [Papilio machaon]|uniref:cuticle protein 7 n=1 Tax=Papilio machaon TaxID=76193 RepID=UPI001E665C0D|nr:cuticle protein 7 [Papilio machaon]
MYAKLLMLCCAWAAVSAAPGLLDIGLSHGYAAPSYTIAAPAITTHAIAAPAVATHAIAAPVVRAEPIDPNPAYSFSYGVADPHTGDQKEAQETLQNGVVHGSYSLVEPDGHVRKVTYTADKVNGFNAVVQRTGGTHAAPVAVAAPIAKVALAPAPVAVAAPVAKLTLPALGHPW